MSINHLGIPTRIYGQIIPVALDMNEVVNKINELVDAMNGGLGTSNALVGGTKYVRYRDSKLYGVTADDLTLDRLNAATILPGTLAVVVNPSDTPTSATEPLRQYIATIVASGTPGAVKVAAYFGAPANAKVDVVWVALSASAGSTAPTITGFLPMSGARGSTVVLTGTHFTGATLVSINSAAVASFNVDSATQITAVLSNAQATGKIRVATAGGTAVSASDFTVTVPAGNLRVRNTLYENSRGGKGYATGNPDIEDDYPTGGKVEPRFGIKRRNILNANTSTSKIEWFGFAQWGDYGDTTVIWDNDFSTRAVPGLGRSLVGDLTSAGYDLDILTIGDSINRGGTVQQVCARYESIIGKARAVNPALLIAIEEPTPYGSNPATLGFIRAVMNWLKENQARLQINLIVEYRQVADLDNPESPAYFDQLHMTDFGNTLKAQIGAPQYELLAKTRFVQASPPNYNMLENGDLTKKSYNNPATQWLSGSALSISGNGKCEFTNANGSAGYLEQNANIIDEVVVGDNYEVKFAEILITNGAGMFRCYNDALFGTQGTAVLVDPANNINYKSVVFKATQNSLNETLRFQADGGATGYASGLISLLPTTKAVGLYA